MLQYPAEIIKEKWQFCLIVPLHFLCERYGKYAELEAVWRRDEKEVLKSVKKREDDGRREIGGGKDMML